MAYSDNKRPGWGCMVIGAVAFALTFCVLFWLVFPLLVF
jgi:hypothetical protein